MALRGPRFTADPILADCESGQHVMAQGEDGLDLHPQERGIARPHALAVLRVQAALEELGFTVGPKGLDGRFGPDTAAAVSAFKTARSISPNDPKVGVKTSTRLDDDLFVDPPELDPAFTEFSPFVVDLAVEPFVGLALAGFMSAPLDSWRKMLGKFALASLNSGRLIGIVTQSRTDDLQATYTVAAAATQRDNKSAATWFADMTKSKVAPASLPPPPKQTDQALPTAQMVPFKNQQGVDQTFVMVGDDLVLGRSRIIQFSTGKSVAIGLLDNVAHELTHVRNIEAEDTILVVADSDTTAYENTALAALSSAGGPNPTPTHQVFRSFVAEICARHVQWIVREELAGNPFAAQFLTPTALAFAAHEYFTRLSVVFDFNLYVAGINQQGSAAIFGQLAKWLSRCATLSFSDDAAEESRTQMLFTDAATVCANEASNPTSPLPAGDGLFPLLKDLQ